MNIRTIDDLEPHLRFAWEKFQNEAMITSVFQPIVHMASGQIIAYEVLSRIHDDSGIVIPIEHLLLAAKHLGELQRLDLQMFTNSLQQIRAKSLYNIRYFINVMPESLGTDELINVLEKFVVLTHGRVPIVLEISELTADPSIAKWSELLAPIRRLGIEVAIDDVGSGYAGLNRTVEISPDWMKLDIGLVRNVDTNLVKSAMIASVVAFSKHITSIRIIAEGIETQGELNTLLDLGVDVGQGFLMARPAVDLLVADFLPFHKQRENLHSALDMQAYGLLVAEYLEKVCFGYQNEQAMAIDACHYVKRTLLTDHVEVLKVNKAGKVAPLTVFYGSNSEERPDIPFEVMRKMLAGEISITQDTVEEERPYSRALHLRSSIKVPIFVRGKVYGLLFCGYHLPNQIRGEMVNILRGIAAVLAVAMAHGELNDNPAVV